MAARETPRHPAVFFDRDGVVNARIKGGYVRSWDEFEMTPDFPRILRAVKAKGYLAIVVTNQRGVGRGLMTHDDLEAIHTRLQSELAREAGVQFDDIHFCTDADDSSDRRKPSPAMLIEAADKWSIDLKRSWMVGDSKSDIEAGERAGTRTAYLVTVHTENIPKADAVIHSLDELLELL